MGTLCQKRSEKKRKTHRAEGYAGIIAAFVLLLIAALFTLASMNQIAPDTYVSFQPNADTRAEAVTDVIDDGMRIEQVFTATADNISSVSVMIGTYMRINHFSLKLEIYEEESNLLLTACEINASKIIDNTYEQFNFTPVQTLRGSQYRIVFSSKGADPNNTLAFYRTGDGTADAKAYAQINGTSQTYNLAIKVNSSDLNSSNFLKNILIQLVLLSILGIMLGTYAMFRARGVIEGGCIGLIKGILGGIRHKDFRSSARKKLCAVAIAILFSFIFELLLLESLPPMNKNASGNKLFDSFVYWKQVVAISIILISLALITSSRITFKFFQENFNKIKHLVCQHEFVKFILFVGAILSSSIIFERIIFGMILGRTFLFSQYWLVFTIIWIPLAFYIYRKQIGERIEIGFLIVSLSLGILLISSVPAIPMASWDEYIHFQRVIGVAGLGINRMTTADIMEQTLRIDFNPEVIAGQMQMLEEEFRQGAVSEVWTGFNYTQLGYLPLAAGILFGRLAHFSYSTIFRMGKLFNLLVYVTLAFLSIKKLKSGKVILSIIALFPTNLFLATSYSYDPWVTVWFMFGFSSFVSELQQPDKLLNWRGIAGLILPFIIGCGPKAIYALFMLVLLLMPRQKFSSNQQAKWFKFFVLYSVGIVTLYFLTPFFAQIGAGKYLGDTRGYDNVDSGKQVAFVLKNPFTYAMTLLKFLLEEYFTFDSSAMYMTELAYLGHTGNHVMLAAALMVAVYTDKNEYDLKILSNKFRVCILLAFFITVCAIVSALYVSFTPVGESTVYGCQLRYLLPILFPVYFVIGSPRIQNNIKKSTYNIVLLFIPACIILNAILTWVYSNLRQYMLIGMFLVCLLPFLYRSIKNLCL